MTLTELRYIVAVARERHFGRAAAACHVSQPTLSVGVKKLEEELGVILFERGPHEVQPTPAGEAIVAQAQRVLEEVERVRQLAARGHDPLHGPLRLGLIYTIGPYLLPDLIPTLREHAPKMPLLIDEDYTAGLAEKLRNGALDAIVVALPFEEPGIVTLPLYEEPFVVLLPAGHPWSGREAVDPAALAGEPVLLLGPGHCFRDQVLAACPGCAVTVEAEDSLARSLEGGSLETIRHMVASGLGITVLPCTATGAGRYAQRLVTVVRFTEPAPRRTVALAWRTSFPRPQAIEALHQAVAASGLTCVRPVEGPPVP